jgi:thioredoxin-related protein
MFLVAFAWLTIFQMNGNFAEAQQRAEQLNRPLLLVFSGSDWCRPCILFDRDVLQSEAFSEMAQSELVFYKADLPRNAKLLSEDQRQQNENLAARYNPDGAFPMLVLFNSKGNVIKSKKGAFASTSALKEWVQNN